MTGHAKSAAQRQAECRARRPTAGENGQRRIDCWLSTAALLALDRVARHHGTTRAAMIERLALEADNGILARLDDAGFEAYLRR